MKNHILFKMIAVLLCALFLLGAVGGGVGIFVMTEMNLYNRSYQDAYDEMVASWADGLAYNIGIRYASGALGGCNTQLLDKYYGSHGYYSIFDMSKVGYTLMDSEGNILQEQVMDEPSVYSLTFPVGGRYIRLVEEMPEEAWHWMQEEADGNDLTYSPEGHVLYDAVPPEGAYVYQVTVTWLDGSSEGVGSDDPLGHLYYDDEGWLNCQFFGYDFAEKELPQVVTSIQFQDEDHNVLFEANDPEGVGEFYRDDAGNLMFRGNLVEMYAPEVKMTEAAAEVTYTAVTSLRTPVYDLPNEDSAIVEYLPKDTVVTIQETETHEGIQWGLIGDNWIQMEYVTVLLTPVAEDAAPVTYEVTPEATVEATTAPTEINTTAPTQATEVEATVESAEAAEPVTAAEEATTPEVTAAPYHTDSSTEPTLAVAETMPYTVMDGVDYTRYYNNDTDTWMMAGTVDETIPDGYTVNIRLADGALTYQYEWELFRMLYDLRNELPKILGVSLLMFVLLAVYLCCAAGKKPGTKEIHAGGLNCIPLDLYICITVVGAFGAVVLGLEGVRHFSQNSLQVAVWFALAIAYAASLLIVGFCFACAAQFKTPGGYWWRNSVCGRCLKLVGKCCRLLLKFAEWLGVKWDSKLWPGLVKLFKGIFKLVGLIFKQLWTWVLLILGLLERGANWLAKKLNRFFSLLPLTWQWLLVGFVLVLWLFIAVDGRREGMLVAWVIAGLAAVLYGAHCFGSLLESAKRMSKGDLDEKVDDKLMTGAFKDFAGELNGLADVAVVAAQKQLKSERMKTELITNVSHDIKTPLTSIINYVDLLQKPHTAEDQEKYLEVLDRQSQRLKKLIDDLMEMSKASTGNLSVDITRVDAAEAVNQALGEFADKLDKAQLFPVFRQPEAPVYMMADGRLVWRVMSNLLSNAVKYALPGTRLYVDMQKLDGKVIISLKNISREELNVNADELLERFVRGDASRNTEGSGLGLNIAQSLMELQKGQLQILVDGDLFKVTLIFPGAE